MSIFCYQHHINDWRASTAALTLLQRGVYREMLDWYYATEGKLPSSPKAISRLIGANTRQEKEAVSFVILQFFCSDSAGFLQQKRAKNELERIKTKQKKASDAAKIKHLAAANAERTHSERTANQEPITNNHIKNKNRVEATLPPWMSADLWKKFLSHRRNIKKPLTDHAEKLALAELQKLMLAGNDVEAVVNQSILRGWAGLFPLKESSNGHYKPAKRTYSNEIMDAGMNAIRNTERKSNDEIY